MSSTPNTSSQPVEGQHWADCNHVSEMISGGMSPSMSSMDGFDKLIFERKRAAAVSEDLPIPKRPRIEEPIMQLYLEHNAFEILEEIEEMETAMKRGFAAIHDLLVPNSGMRSVTSTINQDSPQRNMERTPEISPEREVINPTSTIKQEHSPQPSVDKAPEISSKPVVTGSFASREARENLGISVEEWATMSGKKGTKKLMNMLLVWWNTPRDWNRGEKKRARRAVRDCLKERHLEKRWKKAMRGYHMTRHQEKIKAQ